MQRRNFISLAAVTTASMLFSRFTSAFDKDTFMNLPDEAWANTGGEWFRLLASGNPAFRSGDIELGLKTDKNAVAVTVRAPKTSLCGIRLRWKQVIEPSSLSLGDAWERTYGDLNWKKQPSAIKNPWYMLLYDKHSTACFGVRTGCNSICSWTVNTDGIELTMDTHSGGKGVEAGYRSIHLASILTTESVDHENPFATARRFCRLMCERPLLPEKPVYGINDWYYAYGNNSPALIREQTELMSALAPDLGNRPFSVIDAGWAAYAPLLPGDCCWQDDFSRPNEKFKDMEKMASVIKSLGMRPGLWMRPLCARYNDRRSLLAPLITGRDNPKNPVLDPTIEENIERIKTNITLYRHWGYDLVKHDFSTYDITGRWGFEMNESFTSAGWSFNDRSKTNAEIITHLYRSIRQAAGSMYLNGCNTIGHLSAGLFELNRTGDDTSGKEWARTLKMGVNTLAFRMPQHGAFYAMDADCVGLTRAIPWEKNKQWMQLLAESSAPLFISAQPDAMEAPQKAFIRQCFQKAARPQPVAEPLDWLEHPHPSNWKINHQAVSFDWS